MNAHHRGACPACKGSGRLLSRPCPICGGRGRTPLNFESGISRLRALMGGMFPGGRLAHAPPKVLFALARGEEP